MNTLFTPNLNQLKVDYGGYSNQGARDTNQDALMVRSPENTSELSLKGIVACMADGASCSEHGQQASHTAVTQMALDYYATPESWGVKRSAGKVLDALNRWLFQQGEQQALSHNSFVTTLSAMVFKSNLAYLFHAGDTRIYRLRENTLQQLTRDHRRGSSGSHTFLTRALGMDHQVEIDYQAIALKAGDRFIFTTDGVHDWLSKAWLAQQCRDMEQDKEQLSQAVCKHAIRNGSPDNVSCLIIDITHLPPNSTIEQHQETEQKPLLPILKVGQRIDQFEVGKILYASSRSHVYQVVHEPSQEKYVIKAISPSMSEESTLRDGFLNEYWVGQQIHSPHVMQVFPYVASSQFSYLLCEYIDGITLRQWMHDHPTPELSVVRNILAEVISATRVFQRAGMVHRDLKPENIMITPAGHIKLIDFGATKVESLAETSLQPKQELPVGSVNYTAPESIRDGSADSRSDLFSIACIGFEMLTGELPYSAFTSQSILQARHKKWQYRPLVSFRHDLPKWLDLTLEKACQPSPIQRYQALGDFMTDLYTPNVALQKELSRQPLLKRQPIAFWRGVSALMLLIALLELLFILAN